jgi:hypothetical protein
MHSSSPPFVLHVLDQTSANTVRALVPLYSLRYLVTFFIDGSSIYFCALMIKPLIQLNMKSRFAAVVHLLVTEVIIIAVKNYIMCSHG